MCIVRIGWCGGEGSMVSNLRDGNILLDTWANVVEWRNLTIQYANIYELNDKLNGGFNISKYVSAKKEPSILKTIDGFLLISLRDRFLSPQGNAHFFV